MFKGMNTIYPLWLNKDFSLIFSEDYFTQKAPKNTTAKIIAAKIRTIIWVYHHHHYYSSSNNDNNNNNLLFLVSEFQSKEKNFLFKIFVSHYVLYFFHNFFFFFSFFFFLVVYKKASEITYIFLMIMWINI